MTLRALPIVLALGCAGSKTVEKDAPSDPTPAPAPAEVAPAQPEVAMKIPGMRAAPRPEHASRAGSLAITLHQELVEEGKNSASSGPSLMVAFSMLGAGARGHTLEEMGAMFGAPVDDLWHIDNERLLAAWGDTRGVQLATANAVWVEDGLTLDPGYVEKVGTHYGTAPSTLPFSADPNAAAGTMDAWTREHTFGMIDRLFAPEDLPGVKLVLANAIAFKGTWKVTFPAEKTRPGAFAVKSGPVDVPMMSERMTVRHSDGDGWSAVVLPYSGETTSMIVILPDEGVPLANVEAKLTHGLLDQLPENGPKLVSVTLPRFKMAVEHDLNPVVAAMGAPSLFGGADLSGFGVGGLVVDKAIQKVFVEVDEQGTEAAAVTAIAMKRSASAEPQVVPFHVDRPFLFAIWHHETHVPLFLGRVVDPRG